VLAMLGNILYVGAECTVHDGDVRAVGTIVQKDVGAFCTVEQKEVVAAGTDRKCWFFPGNESTSAVSRQSSVISPGLKVIDPMLWVGDGRCAGDIPSSLVCRFTPARAYPGWCCSVRHGVRSRGEEETSPVQINFINKLCVCV